MEVETVVNGSNESETDTSEKILKPRKPKNIFVSSKEHKTVIQNGNSESSSVSDITENHDIENGHVDEPSKQNGNDSVSEENVQEFKDKEIIPRKLRRESRKESTPKPETPIKRELRRRETTPRASTPKKNAEPSPSTHLRNEKLIETSEYQIEEDQKKNEADGNEIKTQQTSEPEESIIILEETREDIISINESAEGRDPEAIEKSTSIFSVFSKNYKSNLSAEIEDSVESSSSVICLDSPSYNPSKEIKGRKPINSCSKFPGRTVSIISLDSSTKRKADDDSFDNSVKKRFAGDVESGSEKSPGMF